MALRPGRQSMQRMAIHCMTMAAGGIRVQIARTLVWALWLGGWLALGTLGRQLTPLWLGGLAPLALWLACLALADTRRARPVLGAGVLIAGGSVAAAALAWIAAAGSGGQIAVLVAAAAWGLLLGAAIGSLRALRSTQPSNERRALRTLSAVLGALLALALTGDLEPRPALWAGALAAASLGLGVLVPAQAVAPRSGLSLAGQVRGQDWIVAIARWTMLPMMSSLAAMAEMCSTAGAASRLPSARISLPCCCRRSYCVC